MHALSQHKQLLIHRLQNMGMDKSAVLGFIWSLKSLFLINPGISNLQINGRLESLGWRGFNLDDRTLEMAIACFEAEGMNHNKDRFPATA